MGVCGSVTTARFKISGCSFLSIPKRLSGVRCAQKAGVSQKPSKREAGLADGFDVEMTPCFFRYADGIRRPRPNSRMATSCSGSAVIPMVHAAGLGNLDDTTFGWRLNFAPDRSDLPQQMLGLARRSTHLVLTKSGLWWFLMVSSGQIESLLAPARTAISLFPGGEAGSPITFDSPRPTFPSPAG